MPGTSTIGGLITGLDTATLIDQLIAISRRRIDLVANNQTTYSNKLGAYQSLNTKLLSFKSKADILRSVDTFNVFKNAITTDSTNFKASELLSVSTTKDANPGTHTIEFTSSSQLAQARQLSSKSFSSKTTSLTLTGEFVINGQAIRVTATDSLDDIASSINNANSGINATGLTAAILTISSIDNRLILTSDNTGEDKFSILDASAETSEDILQALGFTTAKTNETIKNTTSDGAQSDGFSSSDNTIKSLLGLTNAQSSATVDIDGTNIAIALATDTLTTIASTIDGVTGVSASVKSTTTDGVETFFIDISGTTDFTDNNNILETLGILVGTNASVNELHAGSVVNTIDGSTAITGTDRFSQIFGANVGTNDTVTIQGTRNDGTAITTTTYNIYSGGTYNDIDNLLLAIESQYGGATYVNAYVSDGTDGNTEGQIAISDLTAGDSQISLTLITNNEDGGSLDFGAVTATTEGYDMQTTTGQDASVKIDGVGVTRNSNSIDDVINGVTIDLARVESGSTVNLTISRDTDSIKSSANDFITEYNGIIEFISQQFTFDEDTKSSGLLAGESALSTIKSTIQSTITSTNLLLPADFDALALIGITSKQDGKLALDDSDFLSALNTDFNAVRRLFTPEGSAVNSEITYISHTKDTVAGEYAVVINTFATQATATGTADLSGGIGATNTETITITDTVAASRVATINLDGDPGKNGSSIDNIVNAINSELAAEYTQIIVGDNAPLAGGSPITSTTTFGAFDGNTLNQNDEVISFSGTTRTGISIINAFTITDKDTTTIQDFLTFIEDTYNNEISATINSTGYLVLQDNKAGDSQLAITIPAYKGVDFGSVTTAGTGGVKGRYAMEITASKNGSNQLVITHDNYGSSGGFTITEANDYSGIVDGAYTGEDVVGTIGGVVATGNGQILTVSGSTANSEGLSIRVTSTTTGSKDDVKLTIGVAEEMYRELDYFTDQFDGLVTVKMDGFQDTIDLLQDDIDAMEARLLMERTRLERQFVQLEVSLAKLKSVSSFLAQQLGSLTNLIS